MSLNSDAPRCPLKRTSIKESILNHIMFTLGNDVFPANKHSYFQGLAYSVRDRLIECWLETQRSLYHNPHRKRVYYLSMEFLPGRFLLHNIHNLNIYEECSKALADLGFDLNDLYEEEWDPGLGNGGLGRLASCFMDSLACLGVAGYGYGIRYDYGIFYQVIKNGYQQEHSDNWIRFGSPWEIRRRQHLYPIRFYGRSEAYTDSGGKLRYRWVDTQDIMAMANDILVPGYDNSQVNNMRLWSAVSDREFNLEHFNQGDYVGAVQEKIKDENISKVLYPSDERESGKELRLKQQYFLVAATLKDILRRFRKLQKPFKDLPQYVAIQLNDTHPTLAIPEFMRVLMDIEGLGWDEAWSICEQTFAYTNHTLLPEALEKWPVHLLGKVLPRHLQIIYEINRRFLDQVTAYSPADNELLASMSIIEEGENKQVRMSNLAIVGSHKVNGVSKLHSNLLQNRNFRQFNDFYPQKFVNITNGVTPRQWLLQCNPPLSQLISSRLGPKWITDLPRLQELIPLASDPEFRREWRQAKLQNKKRLAHYILRKTGHGVDPKSLFDVQVKRIHEYKRQLLNVLHVITLYNRLREEKDWHTPPRTIIFSGKAAPGYAKAKLIIKLINEVARTVNNDLWVQNQLKIVFLPNYCVSSAEKIVPGTELSQQISTAGLEASGTGNMKFALNGALLIGTLDGANIEILDHVGQENIFIFGHNAEEIYELRNNDYDPFYYYSKDLELRKALDMVSTGYFCPQEPYLFKPLVDSLLYGKDPFMLLADYRSYVDTQYQAGKLYLNQEEWTRRSILNTANMGYFSSDRCISEYCQKIWKV